MRPYVPLVESTRSGRPETLHLGAVVGLGSDGSVRVAAGDPTVAVYPRSCAKPLQAEAMVRHGLRLPDDQLALVCSSHDGRPEHLAACEAILASAGLAPDALGNTRDLPLDRGAADDLVRAGGRASALAMTCSGKHAGMLATCVLNGWPSDTTYLMPPHPLQQAIVDTIADLTGEVPSHLGVDGCGAATPVMSLLALARGYAQVASSGSVVHRAMTTEPEMVAGPRRDVTLLMRAVPGLMVKDGFGGTFAAALPDGRAVAVRIADGSSPARLPVVAAALQALGVDLSDAPDEAVRSLVYGHGQPVGEYRMIAALD